MVNCHYLYGPNNAKLVIGVEVSNNGMNFTEIAVVPDITAAADGIRPSPIVGAQAAFVRFRYTFDVTGATKGEGASCFDVHAEVDHS